MNEIIPIVGGMLGGFGLYWMPRRLRLIAGAVVAVAVGALATVVSGEFRVSWGFLLFDVPLAALGTVAGYLGARQFAQWLPLRSGQPDD